jgi:hypothetical protein
VARISLEHISATNTLLYPSKNCEVEKLWSAASVSDSDSSSTILPSCSNRAVILQQHVKSTLAFSLLPHHYLYNGIRHLQLHTFIVKPPQTLLSFINSSTTRNRLESFIIRIHVFKTLQYSVAKEATTHEFIDQMNSGSLATNPKGPTLSIKSVVVHTSRNYLISFQ